MSSLQNKRKYPLDYICTWHGELHGLNITNHNRAIVLVSAITLLRLHTTAAASAAANIKKSWWANSLVYVHKICYTWCPYSLKIPQHPWKKIPLSLKKMDITHNWKCTPLLWLSLWGHGVHAFSFLLGMYFQKNGYLLVTFKDATEVVRMGIWK